MRAIVRVALLVTLIGACSDPRAWTTIDEPAFTIEMPSDRKVERSVLDSEAGQVPSTQYSAVCAFDQFCVAAVQQYPHDWVVAQGTAQDLLDRLVDGFADLRDVTYTSREFIERGGHHGVEARWKSPDGGDNRFQQFVIGDTVIALMSGGPPGTSSDRFFDSFRPKG